MRPRMHAWRTQPSGRPSDTLPFPYPHPLPKPSSFTLAPHPPPFLAVFYLHHATWSVVFWPLWLVAAICGVGLFLLLCFGVPMLSRRYPIRQFLMVLPPLLLLLATYSLALQALVKGVMWLDAPTAGVAAAEVMG